MTQTAVESLFQELWDRPKDKRVWYYILEKALRMEKEQIMNAYLEGESDAEHLDNSAELYYNETFNTKEK